MGMYFEYALGEVNENKRRYDENAIDILSEIFIEDSNRALMNENVNFRRAGAVYELKADYLKESKIIRDALKENDFARAKQSCKRLKNIVKLTNKELDLANKDEDTISYVEGFIFEFAKNVILGLTMIGIPIMYIETIKDITNNQNHIDRVDKLVNKDKNFAAASSLNRVRYERLRDETVKAIEFKEKEIDALEKEYKQNKK